MKITLIGIYNGKPYYELENSGKIIHAFGFEAIKKELEKYKGKIELVESRIIEEHSKLIELIKNRK